MSFDIIEKIKQRNRREWVDYLIEQITNTRIWIQENGEKAALLFLGVGIGLVIFFKLVVFLLILSGIAGFTVWYLAEPDPGAKSSERPLNGQSTDQDREKLD